ncbi:MAG: class C sortase [Clostridia bacterium]|nr:class C sortase [Clostridia bacterium]
MKKKKKGTFTTIIIILIALAGIALLLYPTLSNYWNSRHATMTIMRYTEQVAKMSDEEINAMWQAAVQYNERLSKKPGASMLSDAEKAEYQTLLDVGNTGVMGYVEIKSLDVFLPIYHGTDDTVLQIAAGHVDWTSLPVGGASTHSVISGHRGLPSAKLFTDLDELVIGDTFTVNVLGTTMTYEVDQILTVLPHEMDALTVTEGMDYCTLMTCTPYGINTHRLLVRGHRVPNELDPTPTRVVSEAVQISPILVCAITAAIPLLLIVIAVLRRRKEKRARKTVEPHNEKSE